MFLLSIALMRCDSDECDYGRLWLKSCYDMSQTASRDNARKGNQDNNKISYKLNTKNMK